MIRLNVISDTDDLSEIVEISLDKPFMDLRDYFRDGKGHSAVAVEILSVQHEPKGG